MLVLALFLVMCAGARARTFNVTYLDVPEIVPPNKREVEVECRYDANFTLLSWFKGPNEFFRYRPRAAPSIRSFPVIGIGSVELLTCGPVACQLRLGALTEEATGIYRCDIERDVPPYRFASMTAHMEVHGPHHRKPLINGLAPEYADGEIIQAYCRGGPESEIRWYINGLEIGDCRNSPHLKYRSNRFLFKGKPPQMLVQCAEFRYGKVYSSRQQMALWNETLPHKLGPFKVTNGSNIITGRLGLLSIFLCLLDIQFYG